MTGGRAAITSIGVWRPGIAFNSKLQLSIGRLRADTGY